MARRDPALPDLPAGGAPGLQNRPPRADARVFVKGTRGWVRFGDLPKQLQDKVARRAGGDPTALQVSRDELPRDLRATEITRKPFDPQSQGRPTADQLQREADPTWVRDRVTGELVAADQTLDALWGDLDTDRPPPLGVPGGFYARRAPEGMERFRRGERGQSTDAVDVQPRYLDGSQHDPGWSWSTERIAETQRELVAAGLLTQSFRLGLWDPVTMGAYEQLLGHANRSGRIWQDELRHWKANGGGAGAVGELPTGFVAPAFEKPDPAELAQLAKQAVSQRLGREATDRDLADLTAYLGEQSRAQYDAAVARGEAEHGAVGGGAADMTDAEQVLAAADGTLPTSDGGTVIPEPVQGVSMADRFLEFFDEKFAGEDELIDRRETGKQNTDTLQGGFASLRAAIGGLR